MKKRTKDKIVTGTNGENLTFCALVTQTRFEVEVRLSLQIWLGVISSYPQTLLFYILLRPLDFWFLESLSSSTFYFGYILSILSRRTIIFSSDEAGNAEICLFFVTRACQHQEGNSEYVNDTSYRGTYMTVSK